MQKRKLGLFSVSAIGLGCMNLSHAYGTPPDPRDAARLLHRALELGYTHFDTAALYGFGANEMLIGETIGHRRREFMLASKGGMFKNAEGKREIDGRPETLKQHCEASLRRLRTDVIDLYYLHRWDKRVPIEESVGALAKLVQEGKVLEHWPLRGLRRDAAQGARRASHRRRADGILAVDAQPGDRRARSLPRDRRGLRRLQPAGARLSDGRAPRCFRRSRRAT